MTVPDPDEAEPFMPPHCFGCTIEHNGYKTICTSIAVYEELYSEDFTWVSAESRTYALEHNQLWELAWNPDTPGIFYKLCAGRWCDIVKYYKANVENFK